MIKMVLGYDHLYYVSLCEKHHSIKLTITPDNGSTVTSQGCQERCKLVEEFNSKLLETVKAFIPASRPPQCYIPCRLCAKLHLKLDIIRADYRPLHCFNGRLPEDYYNDLRQHQGIIAHAVIVIWFITFWMFRISITTLILSLSLIVTS